MKGGVVVECLNRFNAKMARTGSSIRGDKIKASKMILDETFYDDASFQSGVYFWRLGLLERDDYEDEDEIGIRIYKRTFSNANGWTCKFQTLTDTPVQIGDVIYCSDKQEYFLCTESFDVDGIHYQGKLTLCNWILRWQDKKGAIFAYPAYVINATQYNSGEQATRQYTIGSSQHMIKLPYDLNTVCIRSPQRFMLDRNYEDPITYQVTQNDTTTYNIGGRGIVLVTVLETPFNKEVDRIDLGICDYKDLSDLATDNSDSSNSSTDEPETQTIKSVIKYKSKTIKVGGSAKTFTAQFIDDDGVELDITPKWQIVCDFVDKLIVTESGNKISIATKDDSCVDEDFRLILTDSEDNYESSLIVSVVSLL